MKASTHDGRFHADEIFALAVLKLIFPDLEIVRSRHENVYKTADIIVDVGHIYDPDNLIFDHHQRSFSINRESGIPYASFGLVWKKYGKSLCVSSEASEYIDTVIVQSIDADDNGIEIFETMIDGIRFHTLSDIIESFVPRYVDDEQVADYCLTDSAVSFWWPFEVNWSTGTSGWSQVIHTVIYDTVEDSEILLICTCIIMLVTIAKRFHLVDKMKFLPLPVLRRQASEDRK